MGIFACIFSRKHWGVLTLGIFGGGHNVCLSCLSRKTYKIQAVQETSFCSAVEVLSKVLQHPCKGASRSYTLAPLFQQQVYGTLLEHQVYGTLLERQVYGTLLEHQAYGTLLEHQVYGAL